MVLKTFCFKFVLTRKLCNMDVNYNNLVFKLKSFLKVNWYKFILFGIIGFIMVNKDFTFQLHLQSPLKPEQQESVPISQPKKEKKPQLVEQRPAQPKEETSKMEVNPLSLFKGKPKSLTAMDYLAQVDEETLFAFFKRFGHVAINERKKYGIPSSIILANATLHSYAGKRDMAQTGNNFFAIPCTVDWQGESGTYQDACYRHYINPWTSFRDHSLYITSGKFADLQALGSTDYKSWAKGLERLSYSNEPDLALHLIQLIEAYELDQYD